MIAEYKNLSLGRAGSGYTQDFDMKGQKAYNAAKEIHKKMYSYGDSGSYTQAEKNTFYHQHFSLIKKAAYLGHTEALYEMGAQYEDIGFLGMSNPIYNAKKCVYWYTKAIQKGHAEAHNNLAFFYEKGEGCKQNIDYTLELFKRAAELGSTNGKKNYKIQLRIMEKQAHS